MNKFLILLSLLVSGYILVGIFFPTDDELRAYNVISECWQEEVKICKDNSEEEACINNVSKSCAVKHPEMYKVFDKQLAKCSERYPGTPLDNPNIWQCAGADY